MTTNLERVEAVLWMHGPLTATEVSHYIPMMGRAVASAVFHKAFAKGYLVRVDSKGPRGGQRANIAQEGNPRWTDENKVKWDDLFQKLVAGLVPSAGAMRIQKANERVLDQRAKQEEKRVLAEEKRVAIEGEFNFD